jgi:hypothetical protein
MKSLIDKNRSKCVRGMFFIGMFFGVCLMHGVSLAEDPGMYPGMNGMPMMPDIQGEIAYMSGPVDMMRIEQLRAFIMTRGPEEQQMLMPMLDAKVNMLQEQQNRMYGNPAEYQQVSYPQEVSGHVNEDVPQAPVTYEEIQWRIDCLNFRPDATVAESRERDAVVAVIAGIRDPDVRYKLIEYLEHKEKEPVASGEQAMFSN